MFCFIGVDDSPGSIGACSQSPIDSYLDLDLYSNSDFVKSANSGACWSSDTTDLDSVLSC